MSKALIPGSFDPITVGHLDIITRASKMFDEVIVLISKNSSKNYMLCSEKRALLAADATKKLSNVKVAIFDGLLVDFAVVSDIDVTVKGVRNSKDFEYEQNMAQTNKLLSKKLYNRDFETMLLPCSKEYIDVSSTAVRLLLNKGADVSELVPNKDLLMKVIKE